MGLISSAQELLTDTSVLLGILIVTLFIVLRHVFIDRRNGLPPGPKFRLPVIGNMYAMETDMRKFMRRYRKKYGDIYSLYLGNKLVIFIAGFKNLKEAFVKHGDIFSDRPKGHDIFKEIEKGRGVIMVDGDLWKEQRKFSITTLRSLGMGKSILEQRIHSEATALLKNFKSQQSQPFNPADIIYVSVSHVMNYLSLGGHFKHGDKRYEKMIKLINENFANLGLSGIGSFVPALRYLPGDIFKIKKSIRNAEEVKEFIRVFVNEHMEHYDENNIEDFTAAYIKEMKTRLRTKETTTFTVEQLVGVLADLFIGGTETTSSILRWALVYLINFPDIQEQIYNDIIEVIGTDRLPSLQDKTKLPIVDAFMQECLRHADLTFTTLGRGASRDVIFNGYLIPKEATILADLDSVNQDRDVWKDPEVFRPHRFIDASGSLATPEEFVPFFLGRRSCLGESLARMEMFLFLGAIVQNFKITSPPEEDLSLATIDAFGLSHIPKPYRIIATPRGEMPF